MTSTGVCDRCGGPLPRAATGRPRRWCSDGCRRAAWVARTSPTDPAVYDPDRAVEAVLASPAATRALLVELAARIDADLMLGREQNGTISALRQAHTAFTRAMVRAANRPHAAP